jgi:aminocarboxymuconate-semialdehyde decarboxylase
MLGGIFDDHWPVAIVTAISTSAEIPVVDRLTDKLSAVDCHAHHIPTDILEILRCGREFPSIRLQQTDDNYTFSFPDLAMSPPAPLTISDPVAARSWWRSVGITAQVTGPWTDLFGYTLRSGEAVDWCRAMNEALAKLTLREPNWWSLGGVPLSDPTNAVLEVQAAKNLGLVGLTVGTQVPQMALWDPALEDFWAAASDAQMPVLLHPIFLSDPAPPDPLGLRNAVERGNEINRAVAGLLLSGVLQRHPDLRLIVAHGGAGIPYLLGRLVRAHQLAPNRTADPSEGFSRLYFDSVVIDPRALVALVAATKASQVLLGSDQPFPWVPEPTAVVEEAELSSWQREQIYFGNAQAIFNITEVSDA